MIADKSRNLYMQSENIESSTMQSTLVKSESVESNNGEKAIILEIEKHTIPVFSANELGKVTLTLDQLLKDTDYNYSQIPLIDTKLKDIYQIYHDYPKIDFLPIADENGWISGYFTRKGFLSLISEGNYNRELLLMRNVPAKDHFNKNVVCLNAFTTLNDASEIIMKRSPNYLFDPFVVTLERKFFGISTVDRVLKGINVFLKKDLDSVKKSQFLLNNFFPVKDVENTVEYISHINYIHGPGGDFVNKYEINEKYSLVVLFDVCGKGIKASSFVFVLATLINKLVQRLKDFPEVSHKRLQKEIYYLNNELANSTLEELYATGVIILINKLERIVTIFDFILYYGW